MNRSLTLNKIKMEKIYFTEKGYILFSTKIKEEEKKIIDMSKQLGHLAEVGGDQYHDNFSYEQQTMELRMLTNKIAKDKEILNKAEIVNIKTSKDKNVIFIGSTVTIEMGGRNVTWQILGYGESDPKNHKIAYNTPLGAALIGKHVNNVISYTAGYKNYEIKIKKII